VPGTALGEELGTAPEHHSGPSPATHRPTALGDALGTALGDALGAVLGCTGPGARTHPTATSPHPWAVSLDCCSEHAWITLMAVYWECTRTSSTRWHLGLRYTG
jgi:hypothetical protein